MGGTKNVIISEITYPKIKIGRGSALETEIIEQQANEIDDPYGGVDTETATLQQEQHFAPAPDMSAGVTIDPAQQSDNSDETF